MRSFCLVVFLGAVCAWSMDIPHLGFVRDSQGNIHAVDGVSGNFIVGAQGSGGTLAFAWNGSFGIRKTDSAIEWWDASGQVLAVLDASSGDAVIGFDRDGSQTAWIYTKSSGTLSSVSAGQWMLKQLPIALMLVEGAVLAVSGGAHSVDLAIREPDGVFIISFDRSTGARLGQTPVGRAASRLEFLADGGLIGIDGETLWLRRVDGTEWSVQAGAAIISVTWMGREWLHLASRNGEFALRLRAGMDPVLYSLPLAQAVSQ
jgi:hypothetical protein